MIKMLTTISSDEFVVKAGEITSVFSKQETKNLVDGGLAIAATKEEIAKFQKEAKKSNAAS